MTVEHTTSGLSRRSLFRAAGVAAAAAGVASAGGAAAAGMKPGVSLVKGVTETLKLARVWGGAKLLPGFDDTHVVYPDGSVQYLLWPGDLARLDALGHRYVIEVDDVVTRDAALTGVRTVGLQPGESASGDYRQLEDYNAEMLALANDPKYKGLVRLLELPYRTLVGTTVYGLEIAKDVDAEDGRPVFYQDGCHHAREWPAAEVPLMWAYDLLESYVKGEKAIVRILENVRNIVVPVVNVDGFRFTRSLPPVESGEVAGVQNPVNPLPPEAVTLGGQGRYTRKNRRSVLSTSLGAGLVAEVENPVGEYTTLGGVDPNRNYSYFWGDDEAGSSSDQFSQTYRGTDPLSEQESKNVAYILKSRQVLAMNTNHTSGDLLLWAWGDTRDNAPDNDLLEGLGRAMATYNDYTPQKSIDLYVTTGTCSDYAYGLTGSIGYTFEHAGSSFHPPYDITVPEMYAKNRTAFVLLCTYVCMTPEQRGDLSDIGLTAEATTQLVRKGLTSKRLAHCLIQGRTVDRKGKPVPFASLTLDRTVETPLWQKGAGNPLGQEFFTENLTSTMKSDKDGYFVWHVNPSTLPAQEFAGTLTPWTFTATGPKGEGIGRKLVLSRIDRTKQIADLGEIIVG